MLALAGGYKYGHLVFSSVSPGQVSLDGLSSLQAGYTLSPFSALPLVLGAGGTGISGPV